MSEMIDTGDTVFHAPTCEHWIVACVQGDRLSWMGWPEGMADLKDCTLTRKASVEERQELLERMAGMQGNDDHRARYARWKLQQRSRDGLRTGDCGGENRHIQLVRILSAS